MTQLPAVSTFESDSALFRPAQLPLWERDEAQLEILAYEIARYSPELAEILAAAGMNELRAQLDYA